MPVPAAVRHINQTRLLHALRKGGPMSRAQIARRLEVMRSTAGSLVSELLDEGVIREIEAGEGYAGPRAIGRPGTLVELNPAHAHFLGAEIGVGIVRLVAIDLQSQVVRSHAVDMAATTQTPENTADVLADLVSEMLRGDRAIPNIHGLCISVPGLIDRSGVVRRAPILHWESVPFLDLMRERLPALAAIQGENDANAFAMAELLGAENAIPDNALFLWLDAGVGGAILAGRKLYRGQHGYSGEFGHMFVGDNPLAGRTPLSGSLESFVGRDSLLDRYARSGGRHTDIAGFLTDFDAGNSAAVECSRVWSAALARGLATLTSAFDPAQFVIGGPMSEILARYIVPTREALSEMLFSPTLAPDIVISAKGGAGAAIGCALMLSHSFLEVDEAVVFGGTKLDSF